MSVRLENYMFRSDVGTYKEINDIISSGHVKVNGVVKSDNNFKVDPESDFVDVDGKLLSYRKYVYIMMNKPEGYSCKEVDRQYKTVMDKLPQWAIRRGLRSANSFDMKMTGLVLITDDLGIIHSFKSNKRRTDLVYHVQTDKPVTIHHVEAFSSGMKLKHFTGEISTLTKTDSYYKDEYAARLTIKETSYNDINKMFRAMGIQVYSIELIAIGDLVMPIDLEEGQWKELTSDELAVLKIKNPYI